MQIVVGHSSEHDRFLIVTEKSHQNSPLVYHYYMCVMAIVIFHTRTTHGRRQAGP